MTVLLFYIWLAASAVLSIVSIGISASIIRANRGAR